MRLLCATSDFHFDCVYLLPNTIAVTPGEWAGVFDFGQRGEDWVSVSAIFLYA